MPLAARINSQRGAAFFKVIQGNKPQGQLGFALDTMLTNGRPFLILEQSVPSIYYHHSPIYTGEANSRVS